MHGYYISLFCLLFCHSSNSLLSLHRINNNENSFVLKKQYTRTTSQSKPSICRLSSASAPSIPDIKNISTISLNGLVSESVSAMEQSIQSPELVKKILIGSMLAVGVPSIAACIVEPLLTIVDTIFIGKLAISVNAGVIDLAAMSINNAIFNILAATTAPLCTGTTNLVSLSQGGVVLPVYKVENRTIPLNSNMNMTTNDIIPFKSKDELQLQEIPVLEISADVSLPKTATLITKPSLFIHPDSYAIFLNGLIISIILGLFLNIFSLAFGHQLIQIFFNPDKAVLHSATQYFKIRMLSFPFTLMNYIIVGFSLATQNIIAPIVSILTSFVINVLGDYVFIKILKWGLTGAALATSISSVIGTSLATFLILRQNKFNHNSNSNNNNNSNNGNRSIIKNGNDIDTMSEVSTLPNRNNSSNKSSKDHNILQQLFYSFQSIVNPDIIRKLFSTSGLLLAGSLLNTLTYSSGTKIASLYKILPTASTTATAATITQGITVVTTTAAAVRLLLQQQQQQRTNHIAAHQVVMQMWWFLSYCSSPLCLIAQALLPQAVASLSSSPSSSSSTTTTTEASSSSIITIDNNKSISSTSSSDNNNNSDSSNNNSSKLVNKAQLLTNMLMQLSFLVASISTITVTAISLFLPNLFTDSLAIQTLAQSVTCQSAFSQFLICLTTAVDGLFIGTGILLPSYVSACFFSTMSAWIYYIYAIYKGVGLVGAWNGLVIFGIVRCLYYASQWKNFLNILNNSGNGSGGSGSITNNNQRRKDSS